MARASQEVGFTQPRDHSLPSPVLLHENWLFYRRSFAVEMGVSTRAGWILSPKICESIIFSIFLDSFPEIDFFIHKDSIMTHKSKYFGNYPALLFY